MLVFASELSFWRLASGQPANQIAQCLVKLNIISRSCFRGFDMKLILCHSAKYVKF